MSTTLTKRQRQREYWKKRELDMPTPAEAKRALLGLAECVLCNTPQYAQTHGRLKRQGTSKICCLCRKVVSRSRYSPKKVHAPPAMKIPELPSKTALLYIFQRRMICSECAEKRSLYPAWMFSELGAMEGMCQTCGCEWRMLYEVMCVR